MRSPENLYNEAELTCDLVRSAHVSRVAMCQAASAARQIAAVVPAATHTAPEARGRSWLGSRGTAPRHRGAVPTPPGRAISAPSRELRRECLDRESALQGPNARPPVPCVGVMDR